VPVSMLVINDVMAYIFGFFFGKTRLIKLSPKKTWEGFIGGGLATVVLGVVVRRLCRHSCISLKPAVASPQVSHVLCQYQLFVCPIEYYDTTAWTVHCTPSSLFQLTEYHLPETMQLILKIVITATTIKSTALICFSILCFVAVWHAADGGH